MRVERIEAPRGRVDLLPVELASDRDGQEERKAQGRRRATWRSNRQASYRFEFLDKLEAGMVLQGTEVKSLRDGGAQLKDGYACIRDGELWLHNVHIPPYAPAARENHEPERDRKLLVHRREIERLDRPHARARPDARPDADLLQRRPRAKVEIALARGKDRFDKRESIKEREMQRDMQRALREANR